MKDLEGPCGLFSFGLRKARKNRSSFLLGAEQDVDGSTTREVPVRSKELPDLKLENPPTNGKLQGRVFLETLTPGQVPESTGNSATLNSEVSLQQKLSSVLAKTQRTRVFPKPSPPGRFQRTEGTGKPYPPRKEKI